MISYDAFGIVITRMVFIFIIALLIVRIMGNRTVGQYSPFDFVLMVTVGDIISSAALGIDDSIFIGVEGLVALLILQQILAFLSLKNLTIRKWVEGMPIVLVENGKILKENLTKSKFNYDDLRQELHKEGIDMSDLKDIKIARLESCGAFSIIKNKESEPLSKEDFDRYINEMCTNHLSPLGNNFAKIEKISTQLDEVISMLNSQKEQKDYILDKDKK